jgi:hypothetical protein
VTPQALDKLWRKSQAAVPHLDATSYANLHNLATRLHKPRAQFWGIVDEKLRFNNRSLVHCFNFGNTSVKYPWQAEAVNFGQRLPLRITQCAIKRAVKNYRTFLHQMDAPFLAFEFEDGSLAEERLQSGFVITEPGTGELVTECDVVMAPGYTPPAEGGVLFYFLTKRLPFTVKPMEGYALRGSEYELPRFRLQLDQPMLLDPGWSLLMLEKDRWMWGVVVG